METIADALRKEERLKREKMERKLRNEIKQKDTELKQKNTVIEQKDTVIEQKEELLQEIIRNMLKKKIGLESIREITGLSKERIEQITKDIHNNI